MNTKQLMILTLGASLLIAPALSGAQQGQDDVADAARKARAEQKTAPKAKMVIDNDNLDTLTGTVSVVGQQPPTPEDEAKAAAAKPAPAEKAELKDEAYWRGKFADANKKLTDDARELDVLQREYNLKQQQYYSDPNTALKQDYTRQDLTDTKTKIDEMTATVAADKQAISDLEDELHKAGGDPGWETAPPAPPAPSGQ
jgi:hypothetical protein